MVWIQSLPHLVKFVEADLPAPSSLWQPLPTPTRYYREHWYTLQNLEECGRMEYLKIGLRQRQQTDPDIYVNLLYYGEIFIVRSTPFLLDNTVAIYISYC